jgi:hypothetical protein
MSKSRSEVMKDSQKKGLAAGAATAGAIAAGVILSPYVAVAAAVPAAMLGYRWWKHRSENGIRF